MRVSGKLTQWNDERGFGFIEVVGSTERLFVHLSAFERGRLRPPLGALLEFDVQRDGQGRKRAVDVRLPGDKPGRRVGIGRRTGRGAPGRRGFARWGIGLAIVGVLLAVGARYWKLAAVPVVAATPASSRQAVLPEPMSPYRCDGRTRCSQMHSCAEATWFLQHCSATEMDGNRDGVPCEQQWCRP